MASDSPGGRGVLTYRLNRLAFQHRGGILGNGLSWIVRTMGESMVVHGKFGEDCPVCGAPIQKIVAGGRETNYCPGCQTNGRILANRSLSRLLKDDWPKTLDEL